MPLNYRSYVEAIESHIHEEAFLYSFDGGCNQKNLALGLFLSVLKKKEREDYGKTPLASLEQGNANNYYLGRRNVSRNIKKLFSSPYEGPDKKIHERVSEYFSSDVVRLLDKAELDEMLDWLLCLIRESIIIDKNGDEDNDTKDMLITLGEECQEQKESLGEFSPKDLGEFLAETFICAIFQENRVDHDESITPSKAGSSVKPQITSCIIPFSPNGFFTGRESQLQHIHEFFSADRSTLLAQTITGLGGIGKTQMALKYAYDYMPSYSFVCWINAEKYETIIDSVQKFLEYWNMPESGENVVPGVKSSAFLKWFQDSKNQNWLLILDNAEEWCVIEPFLPKGNHIVGNILITTRRRQGFEKIDKGQVVDVGVFDEEEAVAFLLHRTGLNDEENAIELAQRLGFLPIALEQAGAYVKENPPDASFVEYLKLLDEFGIRIFDENEEIIDYKKTITTTWLISMQRIKMESAQQLLKMITYFESDNIPLLLFEQFTANLPEPLQSEIQNNVLCKKIIRELTKYSLVVIDSYKCLSIHRMLQEVILENIKDDAEIFSSVLRLFSGICRAEMSGTLNGFHVMVPHLCLMMLYESKTRQQAEWAWEYAVILLVVANYYRTIESYETALMLYSRAFRAYMRAGFEEHALLGYIFLGHGQTYADLCEHDKAIANLQKSIRILENAENTSADLVLACSTLAASYLSCEDYEKALDYLQKALEVNIAQYGLENPHTLIAESKIMSVYRLLGEIEKADEICARIVKLWREIPFDLLAKDDEQYPNYIAFCLATHQSEVAWTWCMLAIKNNMGKYGELHPITWDSITQLAALHELKGAHGSAIAWYQKLLEYQIELTGEDSQLVTNTRDYIQSYIEHTGFSETPVLPPYELSYLNLHP